MPGAQVHASGDDPDQHVLGTELGARDVTDVQYVRGPIRVLHDRLHPTPPRHFILHRPHAAGVPVTARGFGQVSAETLAALPRSQITVCPTIGVDPSLMKEPPPALKAMIDRRT